MPALRRGAWAELSSLPPGNKFCGQCDSRLQAEQPAASPVSRYGMPPSQEARTAPLSARREVSVLFLDVADFTAAAHGLDSEEVFIWMDETMRLLAAVIHKYEGTIDKFTGDGLMALFGAPQSHENDPELAIRAALEMQTVIRPLRERIKLKHGFDFQMRIGINTGPVSGTSISTAVASGVVALMLQAHPELTPDQAKFRLMYSARPALTAEGDLVYNVFKGRTPLATCVLPLLRSATSNH